MTSRRLGVLALVPAMWLAGCADLLPKARTEVRGLWNSYEQAQAAVDRIVPYQTTAADLVALGLDPFRTENVRLLTFSDIALRFPLGGGFAVERLDRGLRECLEAGTRCLGYAIAVRQTHRDRVGNFWLDALNFQRTVDVRGWSFNALVLLVEGRVVYVLQGGEPAIREQEVTRQPLGPLQGWVSRCPG